MPKDNKINEQSTKKLRITDQLLPLAKKKFGEESVSLEGLSEIFDYISTKCFALDTAIGRPGIPTGRLTVIQGKEASGKTSIAIQIMAECQRRGGVCLYLECESAFEIERAASLGLYTKEYVDKLDLDVEPLIILRPRTIPEAFSMIEYWSKKVRAIDPDCLICIVWDSVAATPPTSEDSEKNEDYSYVMPGAAAREVSFGFRRLTHVINENQVALICLNFIKEKIGNIFPGADNTATIAQRPLGQHASVRIILNVIGTVGEKRSKSSGIKVLAKINKNKIAPPHREAEFNFLFDKGIDNDGCMLDMAKARGIIKSSGGFLTFEDIRFRRNQWRDSGCYEEVIAQLKEKVLLEQQNLLGQQQNIDNEEDYGPIPKKVQVEDD